jgi:hypothetical protein
MSDEMHPGPGAFLPASMMYFCSGQPMHLCCGVDSRGGTRSRRLVWKPQRPLDRTERGGPLRKGPIETRPVLRCRDRWRGFGVEDLGYRLPALSHGRTPAPAGLLL